MIEQLFHIMSNDLLSWIYGTIIVKSVIPPSHSHQCTSAALCNSVCMQNINEDKSSRSFSKCTACTTVRGQCKWSLLSSCNLEDVLHNDVIFSDTQMTPWCAPSPIPTLSSTPRWCPSTCRLLSLCWSTSASTSSSGWGGRGSPLARPAEKCSQAQHRRLWWDNYLISVSLYFFCWHLHWIMVTLCNKGIRDL